MAHESDVIVDFVTYVLTPLRDAGQLRPAETLATIGVMKALLTRLESSYKNAAKTVDDELTLPIHSDIDGRADGQGVPSALDKWLAVVKSWPGRDRSIAREIEILTVLEETNGAIMLKSLHDRMVALGLSEKGGQAVVVTQISRLKKKGAVARQAQGLYSRTDGGLDRLKKMRLNYRVLLVPEEVRKSVQSGLPSS